MSDPALGSDPDHPRHTAELLGHEAAERALFEAHGSGRLAHAWLLTGPKGVGKATLAFRFARYLLAGSRDGTADLLGGPPAGGLHLPPGDPVFRRVAGGGHADLLTVERSVNDKTGRLRSEIAVEDVRRMPAFFALTAAEGGFRVCIVDSADEMNRSAANALLKILEEPPPRSVILLVSHAPGGLLATIRSRCRRLALPPLGDATVAEILAGRMPDLREDERLALARLAEGSPGRALALARMGGLDVYRELLGLLASLPRPDIAGLHALADRLARRENEGAYHTLTELLGWWLARLVRSGASAELPAEVASGEAAVMRRLLDGRSLDQWVEVWEKVNHLVERADSVNLDRKQVVLSAFSALSWNARG